MVKIIRKYLNNFVEFFRNHVTRENPDLPFYLLILIAFLVFVFATNIFVDLTEDVQADTIVSFDAAVTGYVTSLRTPALNSFFTAVTNFGDVYAYLVVMILVAGFFFFKLRNKKFIFQLLGVLMLSALANLALKQAFNRARPTVEHLVVVETLSYPSGHAMSAMAFYGFLIYLVFQIKMSGWWRLLLSILFGSIILLIGLSRIYLGVHFPSDVVGGLIAGLIWVAFCIVLFNIIELLRQRRMRFDESEKEENLETED